MTDLLSMVQGVIDEITKPTPPVAAVAPRVAATIQVKLPPKLGTQDPGLPQNPCSATCQVGDGKWTMASMTAEILRNEGGFVNNPADPGAATNYGISTPFVNSHLQFFGLTKPATPRDIMAISPSLAVQAYIKFFYQAAHFDQLPNVGNIVVQLFDLAVNTGVRYSTGQAEAVKVLQHALQIAVDGELGPGTLAALEAAITHNGVQVVNNAIVSARCAYYRQVVAAHPQDAQFLDGWMKRADKYMI